MGLLGRKSMAVGKFGYALQAPAASKCTSVIVYL